MSTEFLDRLAKQLRARRSAVCRRAIGRILTAVRERFEAGDYPSLPEAERDFRTLVEAEPSCSGTQSDK
jgi:predicted transcriptional regulator